MCILKEKDKWKFFRRRFMEFMSYMDCPIRGIALNDQFIQLFELLKDGSSEDIQKVVETLERYRVAGRKKRTEYEKEDKRIARIIQQQDLGISEDEKRDLISFMKQYRIKIQTCWGEEERLKQFLKSKGKENWTLMIANLRTHFERPQGGILSFLVDNSGRKIDLEDFTKKADPYKTYEKVKAFYTYVTGNLLDGRKRYTYLAFDGQSSFNTVAGAEDSISYYLEPLKRGLAFAQKHDMKIRLDPLCYYKDFPNRLWGKEKEDFVRELENYSKAIGTLVKNKEETDLIFVSVFQELINGYEPFDRRVNGWHTRLNVSDLCDIALYMKSQMPNIQFGYCDRNFENPDKRKQIFQVLDEIVNYEKEHGVTGKILEHIGMEFHTKIETEPVEIEKAIQETQKRYGIPIEITKLDIMGKFEDFSVENAKDEEKEAAEAIIQWKKDQICEKIIQAVDNGGIRSVTIGSQSDEFCTWEYENKRASMNGYDEVKKIFFGKEIGLAKPPSEKQVCLIEQIKQKERECVSSKQDFNYHTHTQRCGHAEPDRTDEEFVKEAIRGGIKTLAFTDHIPFKLRSKHKFRAKIRMDYAEVEEYLHSIAYLKKKYEGVIAIESGFEFEYSKQDEEFLWKLKQKVDKMVLGQHFVMDSSGREIAIKKEPTDQVLDLYADSVIQAMKIGLADMIVHPDYFLSNRCGFFEKEELITRRICSAAQKYGIPLEINLGQLSHGKDIYPKREFWRIASQYDVGVVYGKDAHWLEQLSNHQTIEMADKIIGEEIIKKLKFLQSDLKTPRKEEVKKKKSFQEQLEDIDQEVTDEDRKKLIKNVKGLKNLEV